MNNTSILGVTPEHKEYSEAQLTVLLEAKELAKNNELFGDADILLNPGYSDLYMSHILTGLKHSKEGELLAGLPLEHVRLYSKCLRLGSSIEKYIKQNLDYDQVQVIFEGLRLGLDVSLYDNSKFTADQMKEIMYGLSSDINPAIYAKPEFSSFQMKHIRYALVRKLPAKFADPDIPAKKMRLYLIAETKGIDISEFLDEPDLPLEMLELKINAKETNFEGVSELLHKGFSSDQIQELLKITRIPECYRILIQYPDIPVNRMRAIAADFSIAEPQNIPRLIKYYEKMLSPKNEFRTQFLNTIYIAGNYEYLNTSDKVLKRELTQRIQEQMMDEHFVESPDRDF